MMCPRRDPRRLLFALVLGLVLPLGCGENKQVEPPPPAENPLLDPTDPRVNLTAPDTFRVRVTTNEGVFDIAVYRDWAPRGADRFYSLVENGFYDGCRFFRVIFGFIAQCGISGDPAIAGAWRTAYIWDDPPHPPQSNLRGFVTFATLNVSDTRTTQFFINYGDNSMLDSNGYVPFGEIDADGMAVVARLFKEYGDGPPSGTGPDQARIVSEGNEYLATFYPELDYIIDAVVLPDSVR